jgi:putative membrane-bound dehydrogenase-like protein
MRLLSLCVLALVPFTLNAADEGVLPVGADGKPLNLDFETGTLKDWTATGDAFKDQPIKGDTVHPRRADMYSRHQGQYWIGGFERFGDKPTGTLTSVPFKVTHRWASFLVGGGPNKETRVELLADSKPFFATSGLEEEDMRREVIDLIKYMGKEIQIRLVDEHTGHWGHINFDDFRFHQEKPKFPARPKKEPPAPPDHYKYAGLKPEDAAAAMTVPEDFKVTLFAGEPDVMQPIAFAIDDRGRLWVVEAYAYPKRLPFPGPRLPEAERKKGDRIVIFEDTDGDGKFDKRTVFMDGLNLVSGIELGFGGVWVGAAPYLMYIPILEGDKPGEIKVLLDGFDAVSDTHETLNTFCWGPDGWLYGCHGVFTRSLVGKPGTPDKERIPMNCAVWRYHPTKHVFEIFAEGTSNPWGLDYNEYGEFFIEACVIPHCFHIIQGARYLRQAGQHFNPYTYADIGTIADHLHYVGATPHGGNNRSDSAGGGHAHCGLMCYLGGAWPEKYKGQLFMGNIHGRRINMDILEPKGSGYVAHHGKDFLLANDEWARFINLKYGPDGNVYLIDWYDKQACHLPQPEVWDRTNGRIYKISYRGTKPVTGIDLQKCTDEELVRYQLNDNEWYVRHARRILQERYGTKEKQLKGENYVNTSLRLLSITRDAKNPIHRLRGLWAQNNILGAPAETLSDDDPVVRGWGVRLGIERIVEEAKENPDRDVLGLPGFGQDKSPIVRRQFASAIQKLPLQAQKFAIHDLFKNPDDANDFNLPLLYWYALEPIAGKDPQTALVESLVGKIPMLVEFTARRIATTSTKEQNELFGRVLAKAADTENTERALLILRGMTEGFRGRKDIPAPAGWEAIADKLAALNKPEITSLTGGISILFGDPRALAAVRKVLTDQKAVTADRLNALTSLVNGRDKGLAPILQQLVAEPALRGPVLRALANYDDAKTPEIILAHWKYYKSDELRDALNTLVSRPAYANALLDAIAAKKLQPSDVSADIIKAMTNLPDESIEERITKVWGSIRTTPAEKKKLIADWKKKLAPAGKDDLMLGRALFAKTCQNCHTLYGVGGKIGPDITGSNRSNLDYLLENVFDPSAIIPKDYAQTILFLKSNRTVTGILKGENGVAYTVQTPNEVLVINKDDVDELKPSNVSMMPEDQMKPFSDKEVRALFAYLRFNQQVPMLGTPENAKDLFNGKDLTGWFDEIDPKLWSVENGEIVGKTTGLKQNHFLKSTMAVENFKLSVKVKLVPNAGNSGIQFRSEILPEGEMRGPQADIGAGWWGKLYEENGRALLEPKGGEEFVKKDEWNDYVVEAIDGNVKIWINGNLCTDRKNDDKLARRGIFGLQLHAGGAQEVRYKEIKLEVLK